MFPTVWLYPIFKYDGLHHVTAKCYFLRSKDFQFVFAYVQTIDNTITLFPV